MTRKMTEEISPSFQGSKTKLKFTFSTRILNLTFLEKRNKKNQTKWRLHTKKKEESSPGWATKITKISVSLQKELATIGSSRDNSRADASRSWTIQENQARSIPSKNRSGSILALLSGASRVPRVSASSRGGPTTMGGWKRDRGTRHGLVLLGYLAERPTMTATSHHHSLSSTNDGQHLAEWPAHLRGCAWSRYRKKVDSQLQWNTCMFWKIFLGSFNG